MWIIMGLDIIYGQNEAYHQVSVTKRWTAVFLTLEQTNGLWLAELAEGSTSGLVIDYYQLTGVRAKANLKWRLGPVTIKYKSLNL